jgi:hypothetical protein
VPESVGESSAGRVALSRAEIILLILLAVFGAGVWAAAERLADSALKEWEPRDERARLARNVPRLEAGLAMTLEERKATQDQLVKARLKAFEQTAAVEALTAAPAEAPKPSLAEAVAARDAAARHADSLVRRLGLLQETADSQARALEEARALAAGDLGRSALGHRLAKFGLMLLLTLLVVVLLLGAAEGLRRLYARRVGAEGFGANGRVLFRLVLALLAVLFFYEAFGAAGAAFAGVVAVLLLLTWMSRPREGAANAGPGAEAPAASGGEKGGAA